MKHNKNNFLALLLAAGLVFSLQSCLKNGKYYEDFSKGNAAVELPLAAKYVNKPFLAAFYIQDQPSTYYAVVNVASVNLPTTAVTGTLAVDNAWLDQYNAKQDAAVKQAQADYLAADTSHTVNDNDYPSDYEPYLLMPDSVYSIPSLAFNISAGHREDSVPILINTSKLDLTHQYIIPLTIASASLPISNWNHLLINVGTKNQWEGNYLYTATTSLGDSKDKPAKMTTVGQYSVTMNLIDYYSNQVVFTVDPATNKVTVSMTSLLPIATDPSSNWDPATKTFHVIWTSNGGARHYNETYVKQ